VIDTSPGLLRDPPPARRSRSGGPFRGVECRCRQGARRGTVLPPLRATVADTWSWVLAADTDFDDERAGEIGIKREPEQQILTSVA
jgi:hypothetical protein